MDKGKMEQMAARIKAIKEEAEALKDLAGGMQAVERNVERILASLKMLEINITDLLA